MSDKGKPTLRPVDAPYDKDGNVIKGPGPKPTLSK
jgi:hypothetical protein